MGGASLWIALALLAGVLGGAARGRQTSRITNGQDAVPGGNPNIIWQARLTINGNRRCGGSVISSTSILTAAHCVHDLSTGETFNPKGITVCLGTNVNACAETAVGNFLWLHASYSSSTPFAQRIDLAVVQTANPMTLSGPNLGIVPLATLTNCADCYTADQQYIVSGFGNQNADAGGSSNPSSTLKWVRQQHVNLVTCNAAAPFAIANDNMCAGAVTGESGTDSCQGDSGGALVYDQGAAGFIQVGVVSSGTVATNEGPPICGAANEYGVYVRVDAQSAFLNTALANDTSYSGYVVGTRVSTELPVWVYIVAAIGGVVVLLFIILLIWCCCRSARQSHAQRNIHRQQHLQQSSSSAPVRMATAPAARPAAPPPSSPRNHLPPARPGYQQPQPQQQQSQPAMYGNPGYGSAAFDPAVAPAPPPPVVYTPQPVVYTPNAAPAATQTTKYGAF